MKSRSSKSSKSHDSRNQHAVALGARGNKAGGKARAASMTPAERTRIARKGGKAGGKGRGKK